MWLLEERVRQTIEQVQLAGMLPTVEQQAAYQAQNISTSSQGASRILTITGTTAKIEVKGILTQSSSFFAMLFGGGNTTFPEIISALSEADNDDNVKNAVLKIDSPGGEVDGLFDTLIAISDFSKPIKASVSNVATSAAFALAAQTDMIEASNSAVFFGSVGVAQTFDIPDTLVEIASTNAPKKRPDLTTEKGKAIKREELDAVHDKFVESIAKGRSVTTNKVNTEFGQGAVVLADEALKRGMIDSIVGSSTVVGTKITAVNSGQKLEVKTMDLNTLKDKHNDVYQAARKEGMDEERDRVTAHLKMGEAFDDLKTAIGAVADGSKMTATLQATYLSAPVNKQDVKDRQKDDVTADAGDGAIASDKVDTSDEVVLVVEKQLGLTG